MAETKPCGWTSCLLCVNMHYVNHVKGGLLNYLLSGPVPSFVVNSKYSLHLKLRVPFWLSCFSRKHYYQPNQMVKNTTLFLKCDLVHWLCYKKEMGFWDITKRNVGLIECFYCFYGLIKWIFTWNMCRSCYESFRMEFFCWNENVLQVRGTNAWWVMVVCFQSKMKKGTGGSATSTPSSTSMLSPTASHTGLLSLSLMVLFLFSLFSSVSHHGVNDWFLFLCCKQGVGPGVAWVVHVRIGGATYKTTWLYASYVPPWYF